jgi:hypothetical protein
VIRGFRHKGLTRFFETGSKAGIQAEQRALMISPGCGGDAVDYEDYH